jgi:hypothetical protein
MLYNCSRVVEVLVLFENFTDAILQKKILVQTEFVKKFCVVRLRKVHHQRSSVRECFAPEVAEVLRLARFFKTMRLKEVRVLVAAVGVILVTLQIVPVQEHETL